MEYNFREIEQKWRNYWKDKNTYQIKMDATKPKYYVLDMFPYPSGAGLHVGHPLGYIATDIYSRYKRLKGFNVLHPMGYDAYGLPAEQYAIQTGQHPAITTENNIKKYREQLDNIGFSFDWSREVRTCDSSYYKWTQWIFIQLFHSWYNNKTNKAESIETLIDELKISGNTNINAATAFEDIIDAATWNKWSEKEQQLFLLNYRLAYISETSVNWCPQLGTVLANEEVKDGLSERGGYPVEKKLMKQWSLRISAYADRLLKDLDTIDWTDALKESQKNWIGKSVGASVHFNIKGFDEKIEVFTTRPDTIFGVTFMVLAPEHELVSKLTTAEQKTNVDIYVEQTKHRSERDRMADAKKVSGAFTGAYVIHPFTNKEVPIWIADYVLAGYGTGAVMAVPGGDQRDWAFAKHFNLPIIATVEGTDISKEANDDKNALVCNSDFLNGMRVPVAITSIIQKLEENKIGKGAVNFRLRDAIFSRQRYWGEPFPVYYKDDMPYTLNERELPLELPPVDKYLPTETGEAPLARAKDWKTKEGYPLETDTMPGWAGSSWYYLRYMDPTNENAFVSKEAVNYWQQVDLYVGGSEHATGHLLYVRFWTKFLHDLGYIPFNEPAKKLVNQGMIQGISSFVYRINNTNKFVSENLKSDYETTALHVDVELVDNDELDVDAFKMWRPEYKHAEFVLEAGKYICGTEVEKMSKSKLNVISPDLIVEKYGADTLRMYEMFLGPIELSKPWNTNGIDGVHKFLKKYWRLFHANDKFKLSDDNASDAELKSLHKLIKKIEEDIKRLSFNTCISAFMICVNELSDLKCNKRSVLEPLTILLASFAPHISEEIWQLCGNKGSITEAVFPALNMEFLKENSFSYPVSVNGKTRFKIDLPMEFNKEQVEKEVLDSEQIQKWLEGNNPKKVIVVPGRIVNVVV